MKNLPNCIDEEQLLDAADQSIYGLEDKGFCLKCGAIHHGVEPDAEEYLCESCGEHAVMGVEEILIQFTI